MESFIMRRHLRGTPQRKKSQAVTSRVLLLRTTDIPRSDVKRHREIDLRPSAPLFAPLQFTRTKHPFRRSQFAVAKRCSGQGSGRWPTSAGTFVCRVVIIAMTFFVAGDSDSGMVCPSPRFITPTNLMLLIDALSLDSMPTTVISPFQSSSVDSVSGCTTGRKVTGNFAARSSRRPANRLANSAAHASMESSSMTACSVAVKAALSAWVNAASAPAPLSVAARSAVRDATVRAVSVTAGDCKARDTPPRMNAARSQSDVWIAIVRWRLGESLGVRA
jgi:hypothetical protein